MRETRSGRPEASAAIWKWQEASVAQEADASGRIRLRGALQGLAAGCVGGAIYHFLPAVNPHFRIVGIVVLSVASVVFLAATLSPTGLYAVIERMLAAMSRQFGRLLNWIIIPAIFYGIFVPFGVLFRRGRRDALQTFYDDERETYWSDRTGARTASSNRARQY